MRYLPDKMWAKILVVSCYIILGIALFYLLFSKILALFLPFLIAWLIAWILQPAIIRIHRRTHLPRKLVGGIFAFITLFIVGFIAFLLVNRMFYEGRKLIISLSRNSESIADNIITFIENIRIKIPLLRNLDDKQLNETATMVIRNVITKASSVIAGWITSLVRFLPELLFFCIILVLACFYFCADFSGINRFILKQLPLKAANVLREIKGNIAKSGFRYLRAYLLLMTITFAELLTGFLILKIEYALIIALLIAAIDILPVLGVGSVLIPWAAVMIILGRYYEGFGLLIIYGIVTIVRQIMEPRIVGSSIGLNPLITLIAMYVGLKLFGIAGLVILPLVIIVIKNCNDSGTLRLWKKDTDNPK